MFFESLICVGLDAKALNQQSLVVHDLNTGLEAHGLLLVHRPLKYANTTMQQNVQLVACILAKPVSMGITIHVFNG